jgi:hypothetical protein
MKKNNIITDWLNQYGDPEIEKRVEDAISVRNFLTSVGQQKIELIKEYLEPTGITIKELIDRNAFTSLCQLLDAYLLEAVRNSR